MTCLFKKSPLHLSSFDALSLSLFSHFHAFFVWCGNLPQTREKRKHLYPSPPHTTVLQLYYFTKAVWCVFLSIILLPLLLLLLLCNYSVYPSSLADALATTLAATPRAHIMRELFPTRHTCIQIWWRNRLVILAMQIPFLKNQCLVLHPKRNVIPYSRFLAIVRCEKMYNFVWLGLAMYRTVALTLSSLLVSCLLAQCLLSLFLFSSPFLAVNKDGKGKGLLTTVVYGMYCTV